MDAYGADILAAADIEGALSQLEAGNLPLGSGGHDLDAPKQKLTKRLSMVRRMSTRLSRDVTKGLARRVSRRMSKTAFVVSKTDVIRPADDPSALRLTRIVQRLQIICALYSCFVLLDSNFSNKSIAFCPRSMVCSDGVPEVALLLVARMSAYYMLPAFVFVFLTKCKALVTALQTTSMSLWTPLTDLHTIHTNLGRGIGIATFIHTIAHLIRWSMRTELIHLYNHVCGRSGVFAFLVLIVVTLPMAVERLKDGISWERRKQMHVFGSLAFCFALAFHTKLLSVFMLILASVYLIDWMACEGFMTNKISHTLFCRLESGTQVTFENPKKWNSDQLGYLMICVPWISKSQWHPFSYYPAMDNPETHSAVFIKASGDWTEKLHSTIKRDSRRPIWIKGPFASPFASALDFDNVVCIATGIGITPAVACIQHYRDERVINLVWSCRDPSLIEFYVKIFKKSCAKGHFLIYYTGKTKLNLGFEQHSESAKKGRRSSFLVQSNLRVTKGRPVFHEVIPNIVQAVEQGNSLPVFFDPDAELDVSAMPQVFKKSWCMLYCGGARPVINDLRRLSHSTGLALKEESFKW